MKLMHTHEKQHNFAPGPVPVEPEQIINRPIHLMHQEKSYQTLGASGILITKIEHNGRF